jgi:hypothetical protein
MEEKIKFQNTSYNNKADFVRQFVQKNFNMNLYNFININNWEEDANLCLNVINNSLDVNQFNYLNEKMNLTHLRDKRTPVEYACDLILGWVVEDGILKMLSDIGLKCILDSADRKRKFIKNPKSTADIKIYLSKEKSISLELVKDYTGYWLRNRKIELRDDKYPNLNAEKGVLLGLEFTKGKFFLLEIVKVPATYIKFHYPFHKPAYSLSLKDVTFHDQNNIKTVINSFFKVKE